MPTVHFLEAKICAKCSLGINQLLPLVAKLHAKVVYSEAKLCTRVLACAAKKVQKVHFFSLKWSLRCP